MPLPRRAVLHGHVLHHSFRAAVVARDKILGALADTVWLWGLVRLVTGFGGQVSVGSCVTAGCVDGAGKVAGVHGVEEVEYSAHGEGNDTEVQLKLRGDVQLVCFEGIVW